MLANVERVDDTCAEGHQVVVSVFPAVILAVGLLGEGEVCAGTYIYSCVVYAVGLVATPPVGKVNHYVENRTNFVVFGLVVVAYAFAVEHAEVVGACCKTLEAHPVHTGTESEYGRNPFTYIDGGCGHKAVAGFAVYAFGGDVEACATFGGNEPVVLHFVHQVALSRIGSIANLLCILLSSKRLSTKKECASAC